MRGPGGSVDWTTCRLAVLSLLSNYKWTRMVQNCSLRVRVEVGQRDETRGRSRYPPFGKFFSKVFGMSLGYSLGGSDRKKLNVVQERSRSWPSEASRIPVTGNEGSTMIGGGRGTDGMVNKMGSENEDENKGGDNRG